MPANNSRLQPPPAMPSGAGAYAGDLTNATTMNTRLGPRAVTPTRKEHKPAIDTKRKQTLLNLLDILAELQKEGDSPLDDTFPHAKAAEKLEEPTEAADEQLQKVGAEEFFKFQKRINSLDRELRNFANAVAPARLVLFLFRENAADLFPRRVSRQSAESLVEQRHRTEESSIATGNRKGPRRRPLPHVARPSLPKDKVMEVDEFPDQLKQFARDIKTFLKSLNEFPEFTDEAVNNSIESFEADLKYWASCLKTYEGQFKYPAVQRYLHDLCTEMGDHLDTITSSLSMFLEIGIPTIRFAQKHAADNLLNLSTVATFFSAVTATTLQFSFDEKGHPLSDAVNSFWFLSLVFSIASAVNSLLGVTWKQAMYRSPGHRVPWWVLIWIKRSPLIFLVISVAAFSVGLCLFAYSSDQSPVTSALTTVFTAFSSFGLVAVSAWFVFERWTFNRHRGRKWLMDVLGEVNQEFYQIPLVNWLWSVPSGHAKRAASGTRVTLTRVRTGLGRVGTTLGTAVRTRVRNHASSDAGDCEKGAQNGGVTSPGGSAAHPRASQTSPASPTLASPYSERVASPLSVPGTPTGPALPPAASAESAQTAGALAGRRRFANVVRGVISANKVLGAGGLGAKAAAAPPPLAERDEAAATASVRVSRVATLIPELKSLQPMQLFQPHTALVRHLQFSPNGEFLATCSWDRTCLIFKVKDFSQPHRVLAHPQGFVGQVAWRGDLLLTKMLRGMKIWTADSGVCRKTIDRQRAVHSIAWYPQGEAFLTVEGSDVNKLDLNGQLLATYSFERMIIHDVTITNDQQRMLCVASLTASPDGLKPSVSREEKQIIGDQVPILHEVRDITLARNGNVALVSYENKASPQLWKLETVRDRSNETGNIVRLSLLHTYMPKGAVDFAGPSYFGGKDDQLVLCAGKAGDIHIWDRRSGYLLHSIHAQDLEDDMTSIAWNHAASPFMFSTGSHDGTVRIWMSPAHLLARSSFVDLRQSGANTPARTVTPQPQPQLHPAFALEVVELLESRAGPAQDMLSVNSRAPSARNSMDGRAPSIESRVRSSPTTSTQTQKDIMNL
ncbi:WD40 repeat-like protein [Phellopilus nigrolimitatus]|nr:WD40 repeat-like protein [Phellopilus nigrolimitatus]